MKETQQRAWLATVTPLALLFLLAVAAAIAIPLLITRRAANGPFTRMQCYHRADGTLWNGAFAAGYSAVHVRDLDRKRIQMVPTWADRFPAREPPGWFDTCEDGSRERSESRNDNYCVEAFGWPMPALARTLVDTPGGWAQRGGVANPLGVGVGGLTLPREVLWTGMGIDAAMFAAILLIPPLLFLLVRRRLRLRRGECLACGYDRGGLAGGTVCPECGLVPSPK